MLGIISVRIAVPMRPADRQDFVDSGQIIGRQRQLGAADEFLQVRLFYRISNGPENEQRFNKDELQLELHLFF